jgi:hypothetical protein
VSSLFHRHNDLSAILARDFALTNEPPQTSPRKSFFRRLSEKTRIRPLNPISPPTIGLEQEVVQQNTIGQQVSCFRSAYSKVRSQTALNLTDVKYILTSPSGQIQFCSEAVKAVFQSDTQNRPQIFPLLSESFSNIDMRAMKALRKAFTRGQATSIRLTLSPPPSPTDHNFDADPLGEEGRSRQSSSATTWTANSTGAISDRSSAPEPAVAVHLTPLKNELGKVGMFVFILAIYI